MTPGDYVVNLGRAVSETTLDIEISQPILLTGMTAARSSTTETFTISATQAATGEIVLAQSPSEVSVFQNGLLITDYEISGNVLAFSCLAAGDFLVVKY